MKATKGLCVRRIKRFGEPVPIMPGSLPVEQPSFDPDREKLIVVISKYQLFSRTEYAIDLSFWNVYQKFVTEFIPKRHGVVTFYRISETWYCSCFSSK